MKVDQDYVKALLEAFEAAERPTITIEDLKDQGFDYNEDRFIFHMEQFDDLGLITRADGRPGLGLTRGKDMSACWSTLPLRITAKGFEFLEALRNKEVWETLKTSFKDASLGTVVDVGKKLLEGYLKQKAEALIKTING